MNIVVTMKQIPDLQQIRIRNRKPVLDDVALTFGNIDKNALEAGVQLKEATGSNLIVVSAGTEALEDTIKEALAAGADEAYLILDDELENMESSVSAKLIAEAIKGIDDVGIILFGEGSGDNYSGQVGSRVAGILGLPQASYAKSISINGNIATIIRSMDDCEEVIEADLPIVVSVMADINEPRIPSVSQILKAGRKPKEILEIDITGESQIETISNLAPEMQRKQITLKTVEELIKALETEGLIGR
jgi:electron transfer flavoprotein beta subunit